MPKTEEKKIFVVAINKDKKIDNNRASPRARISQTPNGAQTTTQSDMGTGLGESPGHASEVEACF
jgi:hypothetical protein